MTTQQIIEKTRPQRIGNKPVVVLPLEVWYKIENELENLEMMRSSTIRGKIAKARSEGKTYTSREVKKMLSL
ncbi:MAG: hypothetical protein Q8L47_03465 [bacterium]|nr:hypothetical protein [bacterium]